MERHKGWFNVKYVSQQLRCLSIPQTAEVLKAGLPTRIAYSNLVSSYKTALPKSAVQVSKFDVIVFL
jgi:myosin heavy subunit